LRLSRFFVNLNAKYFIDTRKDNNDDTVQILPSVQLHKYLNSLFVDNFTYSTDLKLNNLHRKIGPTMTQADLRIPLEYTNSFFDDYVSFSLGEDFFYNKSYFGNGSYAHDSFQYYSNIHKAKIFSDLTKKYERFTHVMQPSLAYIKPGYESQRPVDFEDLTKEQKELFTVGVPEENYLFSLGQYFYDENMKLKFYQRLSQIYNVDRKEHFGDLGNEMQYNWQKWQLYNNVVYSNEFKEIRESSSRITYIRPEYHFTVAP